MVCLVLDNISAKVSSLSNEISLSLARHHFTAGDMASASAAAPLFFCDVFALSHTAAEQDRWGPFVPVDSRTSSLLGEQWFVFVLLGPCITVPPLSFTPFMSVPCSVLPCWRKLLG